jgi:hypothetical protein
MSYQVTVASSGRDDATMAKSFIIALEGPALTWYTRVPPLSIESWKGLRDKFLLNFQGYRPDTDALAELSLYKQQEKETLREYYRKFLMLKLQLPSVDDHIAIHYAISGLRASTLYSRCIRDQSKHLQELYQLFEKYARSKELHQCKVESQKKPKDPPQSSRTWVRPAQSDSGRDNRNQQQVHTIANQHPTRETALRQEYPSQGRDNSTRGRGRGQGQQPQRFYCLFHGEDCAHPTRDCRRPRTPRIEWPEPNQPTTSESSHTPTTPNKTTNNLTTTRKSNINPIVHTITIKRCRFSPTTSAPSKSSTSQPSTACAQTRSLRRATLLRSHPHDHWGIQHGLQHQAIEKGPLS